MDEVPRVGVESCITVCGYGPDSGHWGHESDLLLFPLVISLLYFRAHF